MHELDEEKQVKIESQLASGMDKPASDEQIQDVVDKKGKILQLMVKLGEHMDDVKLLWSMLIDYKKGRYKTVPWKLIASIVFFFVYLVNPFDVVPDALPILGLTDDVAVLALVLKCFASDIADYKKWLVENGGIVENIEERKA